MLPAEQDLIAEKTSSETEKLLAEDLAAEAMQCEGKETAAAIDGASPEVLLMEGTPEDEKKKPQSDEDEKKVQSEDETRPPSEEKKPPAKVRRQPGDHYTLGVPDPEATLFCNLALMVLLSLLYAWLTPWLLGRVAGQPTAVVWTCSLLAGSYMSLWTVILSKTMGFLKVFFRSTYVLLLALTATHYVGPDSGAAIASLGTSFAAGMLGYAVAEHRQLAGSEKSAALVTPPFQCAEQEKRREELTFTIKFVKCIVTAFVLVRMVWVILRPAGNQADQILSVVEELSLETILLTWLWADLVAVILLKEALVSMETMFFKGPACVFTAYMLSVVISASAGRGTGLLVLYPIPLTMSGFFGYCLAVYTCYKETRARVGINSPSPLPQKMVKLHRTNSA